MPARCDSHVASSFILTRHFLQHVTFPAHGGQKGTEWKKRKRLHTLAPVAPVGKCVASSFPLRLDHAFRKSCAAFG